jgi:predicted RecA/RadA family phage recombinase
MMFMSGWMMFAAWFILVLVAGALVVLGTLVAVAVTRITTR